MLILVYQINQDGLQKCSGRGRGAYRSYLLARAALGKQFRGASFVEDGQGYKVLRNEANEVRLLVDVEEHALSILKDSPFFQVHSVMKT